MNSATISRFVQIGMVVLSIILIALLLLPFAKALFVAAVFAGALNPICNRLDDRLKGRRSLAAGLLTLGVVLLVFIPLALIGTVVIKETLDGVRFVRQVIDEGKLTDLIAYLPGFVQESATEIATGLREQLKELLTGIHAGQAAAAVQQFFAAASGALVQTVLMLVGLFFLLVEGRKLMVWLRGVSPLPSGQLEELLADFRKVSKAVLLSSVVTAAVQSTVAFIGYLVTGVPHPFFFGMLTFMAAFIPVGAATLIGLLLSGFLFATGHPWAGSILAGWSVLFVGLVDNIVKPWVMKSGVDLHGAVIFFALLGGLSLFGVTGLIAGPLIVSFFLAMIRMNRGLISSEDQATETTAK
ncbi:MAG: hypothetical protein A2289_12740 [Deltaproteobacteria bacterium RIFOXYA12_FULL_58_15]|nr:MAG: hypothetical protein A2289_12740 [Deltaproteobacteria bacterium RIFOXYA12_FULL_58_15]